MNTETDHSYFGEITLLDATPKAFHVRLRDGRDFWVPRSLCEYREAKHVLEVESWFASKEGMNE